MLKKSSNNSVLLKNLYNYDLNNKYATSKDYAMELYFNALGLTGLTFDVKLNENTYYNNFYNNLLTIIIGSDEDIKDYHDKNNGSWSSNDGTHTVGDYMIDKMRKENLLIKLDKSKITGLENIGDEFLGLSFDENNDYSIPYFWGTLGIVYNDTMVENAPEHWSDLWNSEYANDIMLVDGAREVMGVGLGTLGYSLNTKSLSELNAASQKLDDLTPNIKAIVGDEMKGYMINGDAAIGVTFSGEASEMLDSNEHLHYVVPSEGSNLWFDNLVIPKTAKHIDEAYAFINFMLRPENAAQNAEYIGYSTPNDAAKELLPDDVKNDQAFYPSEETIENLEVYDNLGQKWLGIYNDLYLQFKMYRK